MSWLATSVAEKVEAARARRRRYRTAHPEKVIAQIAKWTAANPERGPAACKRYRAANPSKASADSVKWREANPGRTAASNAKWDRENPGARRALKAKRNAAKLQRTPAWLTDEDREVIQFFYTEAAALSVHTGIEFQVDHEIPLQGKNVSGLHVPGNLRMIAAKANQQKGNRWHS